MKVMCFGTFDLLHEGHKNLFKQAKQLGDELIVVVARDQTVQQVKGKKPTGNEQQRLQKVQENKDVNQAILGNTGDKYQVIRDHNPDIIALGYDQTSFTDKLEHFLKEENKNIEVVRLKPHHPEKFKSSLLKKTI